jgi:hypothetical protein
MSELSTEELKTLVEQPKGLSVSIYRTHLTSLQFWTVLD